jgi:hypothetical protein
MLTEIKAYKSQYRLSFRPFLPVVPVRGPNAKVCHETELFVGAQDALIF